MRLLLLARRNSVFLRKGGSGRAMGMANSTTPRRGTTGQTRRTGQPTRATGNARTGFTPRPIGRKPAKPQSKAAKAGGLLSAVGKALPSAQQTKGKARKAKAKTPGGPGGLALLAGAGGLAAALTQRNKLKSMVGKGGSTPEGTVTTPVATASPTSAVTAVDPITNGPAGTQPGPNAV